MVILKGDEDVFNFQWNIYGNPPVQEPENAPQYYSYQEQADYTPVLILLDSADNPLEIGVFENDTCIGANTVDSSDSTVVIRSYMTGTSTDSLTFEKYYGSKASQRAKIKDYYVRRNNQNHFEKRKIGANEKADFFVVSFRKPEYYDNSDETSVMLNVWPNPVSDVLNIQYRLTEKSHVRIEVFNTEGKAVAVPVNAEYEKGTNRLLWNLTAFTGKKLPSGLYLLKLTAGNSVAVKKIFIE